MNREQPQQQMVCLLLVTLFVLSASSCGAIQSLFVTLTTTPMSPQPGEWTASAESLGEFVLEMAPDGTVVTLVSFHFGQFECRSTIANERWSHGVGFPNAGEKAVFEFDNFELGAQPPTP
jgi:aromatic ring-opening dioxygenase catalytic subunit (LigB family)